MELEISGISKFPEKRTTSRGGPKFSKWISGKFLFHSILNRNFRKFWSNGTRPTCECVQHSVNSLLARIFYKSVLSLTIHLCQSSSILTIHASSIVAVYYFFNVFLAFMKDIIILKFSKLPNQAGAYNFA